MPAFLVPLALAAAAPQAAGVPPSSTSTAAQVEQRLNDPATADQLARVMESLAQSFLALPVGSIEAAAEGRKPSSADKRLTVRDVGRRQDPNFDRKFAEQMARTRPLVQQSMKALGSALPTVLQSFDRAGEAIERAAANMPDPTYPKR